MPLNKDAYIRYRIIDQCLTNSMKPFPDKELIRERVEEVVGPISLSSLEKDFGKMREIFGAPLSFDRFKKGYYYQDKSFSIKEFPLTQEEISALDFSTGILQILKDTPIFRKFEGAIEKVISGYRVGKILNKTDDEIIQVESPLGNSGSQWLEKIYGAITQKQALDILYQPFGRESKTHLVCPYLIKEYHNRWYMVAYSDRASVVLVFAMDRIRSVQESNSAWVDDDRFDPHEYFNYSFGITQLHGSKPYKVVLSFTPAQANYILSQPLHHSQKIIMQNEKEVRVELYVYLTQELKMMILGYGSGVKVLSPKKLVNEVREQARALNRLYR